MPSGRIIIVMGVSGCGKSTAASALAERIGGIFTDGDSLHPPHNIELMASGTPLSDTERLPWLADVRDHARKLSDSGGTAVIACSALTVKYRTLLNEAGNVHYVFLRGSKRLIAERMHARAGHFMPESLLDSQFATLEDPGTEPNVITVDIDATLEDIVNRAVEGLATLPAFRSQGV